MNKFKQISFSVAIASFLVGCGGSSSGSSSNTATLIDDFVSGVKVKYSNGSSDEFTDSNGDFPYTDGDVTFYVGDIKLGTVNSVPVDGKIFLQDLVGVPRTDTANPDVIKLARFLQSLDSDSSTDAIEINQTNFDLFEDANDTETNLQDNSAVVDTILTNAGFQGNIVTQAEAESHIENILEFHGELTTSTILSLTSSTLNDGDTNVDTDLDIELTFTDDVPKRYLNSNYFILTNDTTNNTIPTSITRDGHVVTITPNNDLDHDENYTFTIKNTIKSYTGTDINLGGTTDEIITFTTGSAANLAPTANAGSDQTVTLGANVTLDASASTDSDGTISSYEWKEGTNILSTSSSFSKNDFSVGTHTLTLTITDNDGATSTDDVTITVNTATNQAAVWNLANGISASAVENTASSYIIDLSGSTDSDGDTLSYEWFLSPTGSPATIYNQSSGNISANTPTTIDFTTADQRTNTPATLPTGTYDLRIVQYEDRGTGTPVTTAQTVTITINSASTGGNTSSNDFILKIDTEASGNSGTNDFLIQASTQGASFNVDCDNDGTNEATSITDEYVCSYTNDGIYDIKVSGTYYGLTFSSSSQGSDPKKITEVVQWGNTQWTRMDNMFYRASNLSGFNSNAGTPDLTNTTTLSGMFWLASSFNHDISSWDISNVTDMNNMFNNASAFNQDINSWQIQNVTNMNNMFNNASAFNQDLSTLYPRKNASLTTTDIFTNSGMSQVNQDSFLVGPVVAPLNAVITAQGISGTPFCSPNQRVGTEFITFTGSSSTGNIVSYSWTDVTAGNSNNFIDGGTTVSETYSCVGLPGGTRTIRLTIEDSSGNTDTQDQTLNVVY